MITELTNDGELDHRLNFDSISSIHSLVDETFDTLSSSDSTEIYLKNGKINFSFLLRNAKILLNANDYDLAKSIFHTLIEHGEALGSAYAGLGVCYESEGKIDLAIKAYKEAIIYEPSYTSLIALSDLFIRRKEYREAIQTLLRANHLPKIRKKEFFEIHKNLGNCYIQTRELDNAEIHYQQSLDLVKSSDVIQVNFGCLKLLRNDPNAAIIFFESALEINPNNSKAYVGLGLSHLENKELNQALVFFSKALQINPNDILALFYLVKCAYNLEKYDEASFFLEQYISSNPYNINILYSFAGILYKTQQLKRCDEICEAIFKINPAHSGAIKIKELINI